MRAITGGGVKYGAAVIEELKASKLTAIRQETRIKSDTGDEYSLAKPCPRPISPQLITLSLNFRVNLMALFNPLE